MRILIWGLEKRSGEEEESVKSRWDIEYSAELIPQASILSASIRPHYFSPIVDQLHIGSRKVPRL